MIKILFLKELKSIVYTFQFQFISILAIIICSIYIYLGINDFNIRNNTFKIIDNDNIEHVNNLNVYSYLRPTVALEPNLLSAISNGTENDNGESIKISPFEIPDSINNDELSISYILSGFELNFSSAIGILLSLLALLMSFNLISSEYEKGTLRLLLSQSVPKWKILIAKLIACWSAITLSLTAIYIICLIFLIYFTNFNSEAFIRFILIFISFEIYLTIFLLIGCFVSVLTRKSAISLIVCLFIWIFNICIIPNCAKFISQSAYTKDLSEDISYKINELNRNLKDKTNQWIKENRPPGREYQFGYINFSDKENTFLTRGIHPVYIEWLERYFKYTNQQKIQYAEKIYDLKYKLRNLKIQQNILSDHISYLSLTHLVNRTTDILSDNSWEKIDQFISHAQSYRLSMLDYLSSKNGFNGRRWFTDDPVDAIPWVEDPSSFDQSKAVIDPSIQLKAYMAIKVYDKLPERKILMREFPIFKSGNKAIMDSIINALPIISIMLFVSVILFIAQILTFNKYVIC